ncbi:toll/interleukin-1 receptor domain-containing protein [Cystobacter fuscus]|uniref:toll/interleukin-1 receptor domain-containing protein n=1 Tax=Cystobacter fuscus TaxID=43 RepID=UPI002B30BF13|nr:toll/interleukin-1 receptor domain-containing protein [Cystobacter fuscus]
MSYVFLSHSHNDKPFARRLAADLRNAGHSVWIDEAEINIGDSLIGKIRAGLDQVDYVAAILSATSVKSTWVEKELEIASNREIDEKRVVVLPLLIDNVELPGFLRGKLYGDFRDKSAYEQTLSLLLRALGPSMAVPLVEEKELKQLREELAIARQLAAKHEANARRAGEAAFQAKSKELKAAINASNQKFPQHAPINKTYAFQIGTIMITLDYVLWAIAKSSHRGSHPLATLLSIENRWSDIDHMLEAYEEMLSRQGTANNV